MNLKEATPETVFSYVNKYAKKFKANFSDLLKEIRGYLSVQELILPTVSSINEEDVRKTQKALAEIESRIDRLAAIQHDAKIAIQGLSKIEAIAIATLVEEGTLAKNASGPTQNRVLGIYAKNLIRIKTDWQTVYDLCQQAQSRLGTATKSIKLQIELDSNLRWAQYRPSA